MDRRGDTLGLILRDLTMNIPEGSPSDKEEEGQRTPPAAPLQSRMPQFVTGEISLPSRRESDVEVSSATSSVSPGTARRRCSTAGPQRRTELSWMRLKRVAMVAVCLCASGDLAFSKGAQHKGGKTASMLAVGPGTSTLLGRGSDSAKLRGRRKHSHRRAAPRAAAQPCAMGRRGAKQATAPPKRPLQRPSERAQDDPEEALGLGVTLANDVQPTYAGVWGAPPTTTE